MQMCVSVKGIALVQQGGTLPGEPPESTQISCFTEFLTEQ